jgi:MFS family permease
MSVNKTGRSFIGTVGAAYSAGLIAGAWVGPRRLARAGHIRVFAACAPFAAVATLSLYWAQDVYGRALSRAAMEAAIALMFAAGESWMNSALGKAERETVIGFDMGLTKATLAMSPFLAPGWPAGAAEPLMVAAGLIARAMASVFCTTVPAPPPKPQPRAIAGLARTAPAACGAVFAAGARETAARTFGPLYARPHYGEGAVAGFVAAALIGSLVLQRPAGRMSDRSDRRPVIAALAALPAAAGVLAALSAGLPFWAAATLFGVLGAGALSFHGIAGAHMADRAKPGQLARATSGLLFVWAACSVIEPAAVVALMEMFGHSDLFWFALIGLAALTGLMPGRRSARASGARTEKKAFAPPTATSAAAAERAYGKAKSTDCGL